MQSKIDDIKNTIHAQYHPGDMNSVTHAAINPTGGAPHQPSKHETPIRCWFDAGSIKPASDQLSARRERERRIAWAIIVKD